MSGGDHNQEERAPWQAWPCCRCCDHVDHGDEHAVPCNLHQQPTRGEVSS